MYRYRPNLPDVFKIDRVTFITAYTPYCNLFLRTIKQLVLTNIYNERRAAGANSVTNRPTSSGWRARLRAEPAPLLRTRLPAVNFLRLPPGRHLCDCGFRGPKCVW